MLKEKEVFLFKNASDEINEIIEKERISFFNKNNIKSKWKLTQLFNLKEHMNFQKLFLPIFLVPYVNYFMITIFQNKELLNSLKELTYNYNYDYQNILLGTSMVTFIFGISYLLAKIQNFATVKVFNKLKIFKKKETLINDLFDEQPVSLNLLKKISKVIGEEKTSEILSKYNGVILNSNIKYILNNNIENQEDVANKFKQISSCFFPEKEKITVANERKETTDEMIERMERELAERGVDVDALLKQSEKERQVNAYLIEQEEKKRKKQQEEEELIKKAQKISGNKKSKSVIVILEDIIELHIKQQIEYLKVNKDLDKYDKSLLQNILSLESRGFDYIAHSVKKEMEKLHTYSNETLSIILDRINNKESINRVLLECENEARARQIQSEEEKKCLKNAETEKEVKKETLREKLTREKREELELLKKKQNPDSTEKEILRIIQEMEERSFDYLAYTVQKEIDEINKSNQRITI